MIPDFKTYLKESVWMDIHKRSTGEAERKEEDINLLDMNSFHKYLCDRYEKTNDYFRDGYINIFPANYIINIMLFENTEESRVYRVIIWEFNKTPYITIPRKPLFIQSDFFKKIEKKYTLVESGDDLSPLFTVKSKDGSDDSSNKFFVEVIDFLLDNIEPPFDPYLKRVDDVNESVWMDIHKRSNGEIERKEEGVNLLDFQGLYDYVCSHYKSTVMREHITIGSTYIKVPVYSKNHRNKSLLLNPQKGRVAYFGDLSKDYRELYDKLSEKYDIICTYNVNDKITYITPKEGDGNNVFCLDVIDTTLNFVEKPILTKVLGESVWMDIHKHSTGDVERKEDRLVGAVKNLVPVDLGGKCLWADRDLEIDGQTAFTYDDASQFIDGVNGWRLPTFTDIMNLDTRIMLNDYSFQDDELHITNRKTNGELVFSNQGPYPGLRGFYYFWHVDGGIRYGKASYFVKNDKNNKCVVGSFGSSDPRYTFCIRLVKDKEVSESVWMDIHKHSTGDTERKEESIDLLDGNEFYEYLKDLYISENPNRDIISGPFMDDIMTMPFLDEENMLEYNLEIIYKPGRHEIQFVTIPDHSTVNYDDLKDTFELGLADDERRVGLYPKDGGDLTNTFVITVIDYLLDHSKKYAPKFTKRDDDDFVDESVWMDIHKRSTGETERREDDLNLLDQDALFDYITSNYESSYTIENRHKPKDNEDAIDVPVIIPSEYSYAYSFWLDFTQDEKIITFNSDFIEECPTLYYKLMNHYTCEKYSKDFSMLCPIKDDGKVTNRTYIDLIEFFINNIDEKDGISVIKRK